MQLNRAHKLSLTYYHSWHGLENFADYIVDQHGIPALKTGSDPKWRYNPAVIARYGLWQLEKFTLQHQRQGLRTAVQMADWLSTNVIRNKQLGCIWMNPMSQSFCGVGAPGISAMVQGQAISLLLRIHQMSPEARFVEIAHLAIKPFYVQVDAGGVLSELEDGCPIFEEFPIQPPSHILSGHIFALLGLYDYLTYFDDDRALLLFENATSRLGVNLYRWDTGYWSYYDLLKPHRLASPMAQLLHIRLLNVLHEITQKTIYRKYAQRWEKFRRNFICKTAWLAHRAWEKLCHLIYCK